VRFDVVEDSVASRGNHRMSLVGEAVLESAGATLEGFDHAARDENGAEGCVTAGNSLPYQNNVWLDIPVLNCEGLSGPTHAAHDFVGDEKDAVLAAYLCDALGIAVGRDGCAERCADYRFENERSNAGTLV